MMFRRFAPKNRSFVPTNLIWILLLGLGAFLLLNRTLAFSTVPVANWVVMAGCILLSLALSVYFLVSLLLYLHDHDVSRAVMLLIGALIVLLLAMTLLRIFQNLSEASWEMEPWQDVFLRYAHPSRRQSLDELQKPRQAPPPRAKQEEEPPRDTKAVPLVLGFFLLCLVCNLIYRPYRLKVAREKGYNTESALNLLTGVIMLLLMVAGIAKPVCLLWLGGLALVLFLLRLPKLGVLHALLFTLFQPLTLMDMGVSQIKYNNTTPAGNPRMLGPGFFYQTAAFKGLNMARKEEVQEEIQRESQIRDALEQSKKEKTEK